MKKTLVEMFGLVECPGMGGVNETVSPALTDDEKQILRDALEQYRDSAQTSGSQEDDEADAALLAGLYTKLGLE